MVEYDVPKQDQDIDGDEHHCGEPSLVDEDDIKYEQGMSILDIGHAGESLAAQTLKLFEELISPPGVYNLVRDYSQKAESTLKLFGTVKVCDDKGNTLSEKDWNTPIEPLWSEQSKLARSEFIVWINTLSTPEEILLTEKERELRRELKQVTQDEEDLWAAEEKARMEFRAGVIPMYTVPKSTDRNVCHISFERYSDGNADVQMVFDSTLKQYIVIGDPGKQLRQVILSDYETTIWRDGNNFGVDESLYFPNTGPQDDPDYIPDSLKERFHFSLAKPLDRMINPVIEVIFLRGNEGTKTEIVRPKKIPVKKEHLPEFCPEYKVKFYNDYSTTIRNITQFYKSQGYSHGGEHSDVYIDVLKDKHGVPMCDFEIDLRETRATPSNPTAMPDPTGRDPWIPIDNRLAIARWFLRLLDSQPESFETHCWQHKGKNDKYPKNKSLLYKTLKLNGIVRSYWIIQKDSVSRSMLGRDTSIIDNPLSKWGYERFHLIRPEMKPTIRKIPWREGDDCVVVTSVEIKAHYNYQEEINRILQFAPRCIEIWKLKKAKEQFYSLVNKLKSLGFKHDKTIPGPFWSYNESTFIFIPKAISNPYLKETLFLTPEQFKEKYGHEPMKCRIMSLSSFQAAFYKKE